MNDPLYIAVDLGAGSGRIFLVGISPGELSLLEVRRFQYPPTLTAGHLRWNLPRIFAEIKAGLEDAGKRAQELKRPIQSIGVDSWAVDYGLIDDAGRLLEDPICYRDDRTQGVMDRVFARMPRHEIFQKTGIQFLPFNTLFQLYAHAEAGLPRAATRLLLIPDLINFLLTGRAVTESTNATTTQLVNAREAKWDQAIMECLELPMDLLVDIVPAGTDLGPLDPALAAELRLEGVKVIAPATHDTGSAVVGAPLQNGWAYISSGTWSLVGVEREGALINAEAALNNFTNEGGACGTIRFLKNVMGLWILESCRREWEQLGFDVDYENLFSQLDTLDYGGPLIFPDDPRLLNPPNMLDQIARQLAENDERIPAAPPAIVKLILDSLAFRYASVLRTIELLTNQKIDGVQIVGGGSQNDYLNQATANAAGLPVLAGPAEATVIGNVLVQALATRRFQSLSEGRRHIAENIRMKEFTPNPSRGFEEAGRRYAKIEAGMQVGATV